MSSTDNWIKLYRWWQEHLKSSDHLKHRRPSSKLIKIKKRGSYGGFDEHNISHNDFRHVRDSLRGKNIRTTRNTNNKRLVLKLESLGTCSFLFFFFF